MANQAHLWLHGNGRDAGLLEQGLFPLELGGALLGIAVTVLALGSVVEGVCVSYGSYGRGLDNSRLIEAADEVELLYGREAISRERQLDDKNFVLVERLLDKLELLVAERSEVDPVHLCANPTLAPLGMLSRRDGRESGRRHAERAMLQVLSLRVCVAEDTRFEQRDDGGKEGKQIGRAQRLLTRALRSSPARYHRSIKDREDGGCSVSDHCSSLTSAALTRLGVSAGIRR